MSYDDSKYTASTSAPGCYCTDSGLLQTHFLKKRTFLENLRRKSLECVPGYTFSHGKHTPESSREECTVASTRRHHPRFRVVGLWGKKKQLFIASPTIHGHFFHAPTRRNDENHAGSHSFVSARSCRIGERFRAGGPLRRRGPQMPERNL